MTNQEVQTTKPARNDFVPLKELTVGQMLNDPRVMQMVRGAVPRHFSPERLLRVMANAMRKTPKLGECNTVSLLGAVITCAALGLEPNTPLGHAYLIPFDEYKGFGEKRQKVGTNVNLILGYPGLLDLSRRSGSLVSVHCDVQYEGDVWSYEYGSNQHLKHIPKGARAGRKAHHAYAHAKLTDGEAFIVLPYEQVLATRDASQGYRAAMATKEKGYRGWQDAPWIKFEHEMACKTAFRQLAKWLPRAIEMSSAFDIDEASERGHMDWDQVVDQATRGREGMTLETTALAIDDQSDDIGERLGEDGFVSREKEKEPVERKPRAERKARAKEDATPTSRDGQGDPADPFIAEETAEPKWTMEERDMAEWVREKYEEAQRLTTLAGLDAIHAMVEKDTETKFPRIYAYWLSRRATLEQKIVAARKGR